MWKRFKKMIPLYLETVLYLVEINKKLDELFLSYR